MFRYMFNANRRLQRKYQPLDPAHAEMYLEEKTCKNRSCSLIWIFFTILLMLYGILQLTLTFHALSLLKAFSLKAPNTTQNLGEQVSDCSCGTTMHEAVTLGCTFDVLSLSWLPSSCRDAALTHEFAMSGPGPNGKWDYWADSNGTLPLTIDEVAALAGRPDGYVYTPLGFHVLHCSFYWRKRWRIVKGVGALTMEARYDRESHVEHCQRVFMLEGTRERGMTKSLVRLGGDFSERSVRLHF